MSDERKKARDRAVGESPPLRYGARPTRQPAELRRLARSSAVGESPPLRYGARPTRQPAELRRLARLRALRAARVVTIAAALVVGPAACSLSHGPPSPPPPMADASTVEDSGTVTPDAGPPDTGVADAGTDAAACGEPTWTGCCEEMPRHCCEATFGYWDDVANCCVTCVEGPMVPPSAPV